MMFRPLNALEAGNFAANDIEPKDFYAFETDAMLLGIGEALDEQNRPFLQIQMAVHVPKDAYPLYISRLVTEPQAQLGAVLDQMRAAPKVVLFLTRERLSDEYKQKLVMLDLAQAAALEMQDDEASESD